MPIDILTFHILLIPLFWWDHTNSWIIHRSIPLHFSSLFQVKANFSHILVCAILLLLASCGTVAEFNDSSHERLPDMRTIEYSIALHKKPSSKLLVLLPDSPDTNQLFYQDLMDYFYRESYSVVVIHKPGGDHFKKRALDSREERIEDVVSLLTPLDSLYSEDLILCGIGEGAYVIPALSKRLEASCLLMLNCGILSPLAELEYISVADSLNKANKLLLSLYGLDQFGLAQRIQTIKSEPFGLLQLAPSSNRNWLSYYHQPLLNQLANTKTPIFWYNYSNYPLCSISGLGLLEQVIKAYPEISYKTINKKNELSEVISGDLKRYARER